MTGLFLGYYLPWDGFGNALTRQAHGFETYHKAVEGSIVNYENLDNDQTGIHDYFKFLKYGFGRATDLACLHIRRGRLRRERRSSSFADTTASSRGSTWACRSRRSSTRST